MTTNLPTPHPPADRSHTAGIRRATALCFGAGVAAILAGCSSGGADVDSEQVVTRDIWAGINLESKGNGNTRVKVELNENDNSGNNIQLSANERLEVDAEGLIVTLKEDLDIGDIDYEGSVPTDIGGTLFRVSLFRADGTINSGSFVNIPSTFSISSPARGQAYGAGDRMLVTWSPASPGNRVELEVSARCPTNAGGTTFSVQWFQIGDTGTHSLNMNNLRIARDDSVVPDATCDMDIAIRRERNGNVDPAFRGGGFMRATQIRRVEEMTFRLP